MSLAEGMTVARAETAPSRFPVNIRITVPLLPRPLFVTLIIGKEKRGTARRLEERRRHPIHSWGNVAAFVVASTLGGIAVLFVAFVLASL